MGREEDGGEITEVDDERTDEDWQMGREEGYERTEEDAVRTEDDWQMGR
jgi:hypothetical protein